MPQLCKAGGANGAETESYLGISLHVATHIIEMEVAGVVSRHPNNYTANGNPNAEPSYYSLMDRHSRMASDGQVQWLP
jgi:hypothetical protein